MDANIIKEKLQTASMLCGDIRHGNCNEMNSIIVDEFSMKLQRLMFKYGVNKIDVCWDISKILE